MAEPRSRPSLARRIAAARHRKEKYAVWDDVISGLGVCVYPSGARSFFLRRQLPNGRVRSVTLGKADWMSLPEARKEARRTLATLLDTPEKGCGPRTPAARWTRSRMSSSSATPATGSPRGAPPCASTSRPASCAGVRQHASRPDRSRGRVRVVRRCQPDPARRGQPRLRDPACDDVPRSPGAGAARC